MALVLHLLLSSRSCQRAAHKSWQQFNPMTALGFCRFWSKLAKILSNFVEIWRRMGSCYTAVRKLPVRWSQRKKILQKVSTRVWMWTLVKWSWCHCTNVHSDIIIMIMITSPEFAGERKLLTRERGSWLRFTSTLPRSQHTSKRNSHKSKKKWFSSIYITNHW